jgi:Cobalamin-independent synthase, Catalytic domain
MDYAVAVNEEIRDLFAAGADIVQVDEPYMQARPQKAEDYGLAALNRALEHANADPAAFELCLNDAQGEGGCRPGLPITQAAVQFAFSVSPDRITR